MHTASPIGIDLPEVDIFQPRHSSYYGAFGVAARYCGLRYAPDLIRGFWQHGWVPNHWQVDPAMLALEVDVHKRKSDYYWVAREDQEAYLRNSGCENVRAIGLPIVYLGHEQTPRKPQSLLVMPAHSLDYTKHDWKFEEYAQSIAEIRHDFADVLVCVHPSCWKNGYWVDAFRKRGFDLVQGASLFDRNALRRVRRLLSSFEYVTTNSLGSHVAYAAYLGAKVSIFGPYAEYKAEDFETDPLYNQYPYLVEPTIEVCSENAVRRHYDDMFCHPAEARMCVEWGRRQVGDDNKVTPAELRSAFRWRKIDILNDRYDIAVTSRVKRWGKLILRRGGRRQHHLDSQAP